MQRRQALKLALRTAIATAIAPAANTLAAPGKTPIIDTHIHLFDPNRPGGIPWPEKTDPIYRPSLPPRYASIARPFGIVGAIAVEASPLPTDNDWILNLIANHPIILGYIGNLQPASPTFAQEFDRLHANPVFLGIRCGNLWNHDLFADSQNPAFLTGLHRLASAGLTLDTANPNLDLIRAVLRISQQIPDLHIVIDHLPNATLPDNATDTREYWASLKELSANPRVFVKLSEIPVRINNEVPTQVSYYREKLDAIWNLVGEDHLLFGSDWPNSDHIAPYDTTFQIVHSYVTEKGLSAIEKFFTRNSKAAYHWRPRTPAQAFS